MVEKDVELSSDTAVEEVIRDDMVVESPAVNEEADPNISKPSHGEGEGENEVEKYDEEKPTPINDGDDNDGSDGDMNTYNFERNNECNHGKTITTAIGMGASDGDGTTTTTTRQPSIPSPSSTTSTKTSNSYMEVEESGAGVDGGGAARAVERSSPHSMAEPEFRGEGGSRGAVSSLSLMSGLETAGGSGGSSKIGQGGSSRDGMMLGVEGDREDGIQKSPGVDMSEEDVENSSSRPIRELKVEDALLYLDQVKIEFGDQPEIYNEFLDIMKNFKEQNIDTPGVINRVSSLFRGYDKLILGFNTFLPEGYKIELRDIEEMNRAHEAHEAKVHEARLAAAAAEIAEASRISKTSDTPLSISMGGPQRGLGNAIASQLDQPTPLYPMMGSGASRGIGARMSLASHLGALGSTIKSPLTNSGVGLNLLPTGVCSPQYSMQGGGLLPHAALTKVGGPPPQQLMTMNSSRIGGGVHPTAGGKVLGGVGEQLTDYDQSAGGGGYSSEARTTGAIPGLVSGGEQPAEFDHAISYVTTIKKRFIGEPQTYKAFLEILHKYQKEQKGIKEVLERVSALFADHPDLLREFTYFLPDPVQDQARERLNRAAKESEMRRVAQQVAFSMRKEDGDWSPDGSKGTSAPRGKGKDRKPKGRTGGPGYPIGTGSVYSSSGTSASNREGGEGGWHEGGARSSPTFSASGRPRGVERRGGMEYLRAGDSASLGPSAAIHKDRKHAKEKPGYKLGVGGLYGIIPKPSPKRPERVLFAAVKEALTARGCEPWQEFLKCVELYSIEVLTRAETLALVVDLFGPHTDLYADFKRLMEAIDGSNGGQLQTDMWYSTPLSEVDFSQCRKCTPSYRALPKDYTLPASSERTIADQSVLNDTFVSVPVGSEENWSFKQQRRNQYEEALFAYEDERFEVDIIIDSTISTIKLLDPLAEEISQLQAKWGDREKEAKQQCVGNSPPNSSADPTGGGSDSGEGSGDTSGAGGGDGGVSKYGRFQYKLDRRAFGTVHLAAMARIYGDHGAEMLELLRKNPAGCIPIVRKRLQEKLIEWQKVRNDLNRQWQEVGQGMFYKSLDRRSYSFKQSEKKRLSPKWLIHQIKELTVKSAEEQQQQQLQAQSTASTVEGGGGADENGGEETVKQEEKENQNGEVVREGVGDAIAADHSENGKKRARPERKMIFDVSDLKSQWDAYRLVNAAIDHVSQGEIERERLRGLWKDITHKWLGLPQYLLYHHDLAEGHIGYRGVLPSSLKSVSPVNDKGRGNNSNNMAENGYHQPVESSQEEKEEILVGSRVMTMLGEGTVKGTGPLLHHPDGDEKFILVDLNYGSSVLAPDSILGIISRPAEGDRNGGRGRKRPRGKKGSFMDIAAASSPKCNKDKSSWKGKEDMFLGSSDFYVLLRLYQILISRLKETRTTISHANGCYPYLYSENHPVKPIGPNGDILGPKEILARKIDQYGKSLGLSPCDYPPSGLNSYEGLLVMVVASLPFASDKGCALAGRSKLEDCVQFLIGNDYYMLFTLDKLSLSIARQLQKMRDDDTSSTLVQVWNARHATASLEEEGGRGEGSRESYLAAVGKALSEFQSSSGSATPHDVYSFSVFFENSVRCSPEVLSMELLGHIDKDGKVLADEEDDEEEEVEEAVSEENVKQSDEAEEENEASLESSLTEAEGEGGGEGEGETMGMNNSIGISLSEGGDDETEREAAPAGDDMVEDNKPAAEKKQQDATIPDVQRGRQKRGFTAVPDSNNKNSRQQVNNNNDKERISKRRKVDV